jgi:hypothetical protein
MKLSLKAGEKVRISSDGDAELRTYIEDGVLTVTALPRGDLAAGIVVGSECHLRLVKEAH